MAKPIYVEVVAQTRYIDENERLIRKFIRKSKKSGIIDEVKSRRYYEKPSVKKRRQKLKKKRMAQQQTEKNKN